jgi:predicted transcriptional regulator of viral defense system
MAGNGHHPRFLIHDSPREADMADNIYAGLFEAAIALEQACESEPSFQYIVTTTAEPPLEINKAPWRLDPVLNALEAESRILGVDL